MQFQIADRVMTISVERGIGGDVFFLPPTLRWDDGRPVSDADTALIRPVIEEVNAFWGSAAEFRVTRGE